MTDPRWFAAARVPHVNTAANRRPAGGLRLLLESPTTSYFETAQAHQKAAASKPCGSGGPENVCPNAAKANKTREDMVRAESARIAALQAALERELSRNRELAASIEEFKVHYESVRVVLFYRTAVAIKLAMSETEGEAEAAWLNVTSGELYDEAEASGALDDETRYAQWITSHLLGRKAASAKLAEHVELQHVGDISPSPPEPERRQGRAQPAI
eukprot:m51a1_g5504 hypothetical protein (215) ;mRNA; f:372188-372942